MYNIKVYQRNGTTLVESIEIEQLESISSFSSQVNGGFWNLTFSVNRKINSGNIEVWNIVEVFYKTKTVYIGGVYSINRIYNSKEEIIEIDLLWKSSFLTNLLCSTGSVFSWIAASTILNTLISDFNTEYGFSILSSTGASIPVTTNLLSLDFSNYVTYFDAIKKVCETEGLFWFIDNTGLVTAKQKSGFSTHTLYFWEEVSEVRIEEDGKEIINNIIVKYNGWTKAYPDAGSQSIYWKREKYIDKSTELNNVWTSDVFAASFLSIYKDKTKKISLVVNNKYDYFSIKGGDLITVKNTNYEIEWLQVAKITYTEEKASIELEKSYNFAKQIFTS